MFKIIAFFVITLIIRLYTRVKILLTRGEHHRIISLRGEIWPHKTSLTQPFFLLKCQDRNVGGHVFVCLGLSIFPLSII